MYTILFKMNGHRKSGQSCKPSSVEEGIIICLLFSCLEKVSNKVSFTYETEVFSNTIYEKSDINLRF